MHPTGGSRRVFGQFAWLGAGSGKMALSRPTHQRVTPAVRQQNRNIISMYGMKLSKFVSLILMLAFVTSCVSKQLIPLKVTERSLDFPPGYYNHLIYLDGRIIGFADESNAPKEKQISFAYEGDIERTIFLPEDDPKCKRFTSFKVVGLLPDGRHAERYHGPVRRRIRRWL